MDSLVADTIKSVYNTYNKFKSKVDIFHVSYSGGKDSEVTLDIVQRALPHNAFVVIYGDTGMEFPDTYKAIEMMKKKCEADNIHFYVAKSHLKPTDSWRLFGPPTATVRWCCSVHKTTPQLLLIKDIVGDDEKGLEMFQKFTVEELEHMKNSKIITEPHKAVTGASVETIVDGDADDTPKEDEIDKYSAEYFAQWEKENTHW